MDSAGQRHRVVIVGGGFGGLPATRLLGGKPVDVTLVDRRNHHLFQPLLYQTATGMLAPGQIAPALRHVVRQKKNVRVRLAEVTGFDLERRVVRANVAGRFEIEYPYDSLIVAAGVTQSYFGHDEFAFFAPGMKTLDDALELRRRIFGAFEVAETVSDPAEKEHWLTVVVVGAGPTGVELAGQVRELATRSLRGEFRTFEASAVRVILVDGGKDAAGHLRRPALGKAAKTLAHLGIEAAHGVPRWSASMPRASTSRRPRAPRGSMPGPPSGRPGSRRPPWPSCWPTPREPTVDRAGRIAVLPDLTLPGHPEVFAVGDMASLDNLPGVAEVAMQGGLHAANTILRRLKNEDRQAVQIPGPRECGHHRTVPGHREREGNPAERVSGLVGVDVRPPGLPHRLRQSAHHDVEVAPLDDRARACRAGVQHGPYRRRPEPSRWVRKGSSRHSFQSWRRRTPCPTEEVGGLTVREGPCTVHGRSR